jgi:hypothetical protein
MLRRAAAAFATLPRAITLPPLLRHFRCRDFSLPPPRHGAIAYFATPLFIFAISSLRLADYAIFITTPLCHY